MYRYFKILGVLTICFFMTGAVTAEAKMAAQVMALKDKAAAQAEAERLFNLGIPSFTKTEDMKNRGVWTRVFIGPFETAEDAEAAALTLKNQGAIKGYVVKANPGTPDVSGTGAEADPTAPVPEGSPENMPANPRQGLPVAPAPTYGEPVSPQQARELELSGPVSKPTQAAPETPAPPKRSEVVAPSSTTPAGAKSPVPAAVTTPVTPEAPVPAAVTAPVPAAVTAPVPAAVTAPVPAAPAPMVVTAPAQANQPQTPQTMPTYGQAETKPASLPAAMEPETNLPAPVAPATPAAPGDLPPESPKATVAPSTGEGDAPQLMAQVGTPNPTYYNQPSQMPMLIKGFTFLVDLSTSMRRLVDCGARIKEEAVAGLIRKINQRIPNHPYNATLRVFGYKMAVTRKDFTTVYYGPEVYNRALFETAIARLAAADSVSPFATAINAADSELMVMGSPKAVLMFSDFEESIGSGDAVRSAENIRRRYGQEVKIYTFYVSRQKSAAKLAKAIAKAGKGQAYNICVMLDDDAAFSAMKNEIFGPSDAIPCPDDDADGVCNDNDLCGNTPPGAPVDTRGCWIAAYSQFFDFDKSKVKSAFLPRIKRAAEIIHRNPNLPLVTIAGNTDNIGTTEYNYNLGERRAMAVRDILVADGVSPSRLKVVSFGETRPIADNNTAEGRARNRRVEFHIGDVPSISTD